MSDERKGGVALIAGAVGGLLTMAVHPTGRQVLSAAQYDTIALMNAFAHSLAIIAMPVSFLGAIALTRRLQSSDRFALAALVVYGFSAIAGMLAAATSGFVAPHIAEAMRTAEPATKDTLHLLFHYTGAVNQAFARILAVASSAAIILWSAAILKNRQLTHRLAYYGVVLGIAVILLVASGKMTLDVHGFGLVVLLQAVWFISAGSLLMREAATTSTQRA